MENSKPIATIADHELLHKIGAGSYGEVWLARSVMGTFRAVKIVHRNKFDNPRPFEREYEGIKKFEPISRIHEGFVDVLQVGRNDPENCFYYVMELADDQRSGQSIEPQNYQPRTLANVIGALGRLPPDQSIQIGIKLCRTLAFLHAQGLIHRDIKPSNIIFIGDQPKLADIGLVADIGDAKTIVGTLGYIPPEGPNSVQADIYSLGKLLYELSTGKDRNDFPELPTEASLSQDFLELNEVLLKACHTDPKRRYRSASDVAADLELIASGKSVKRLHHLEARLRSIRKLSITAAILLLFGSGIYYQFDQKYQREREESERLTGNKVAEGTHLLNEGNLLAALPAFVEAFRLDEQRHKNEETHRLRIGSILSRCPRIVQTWHLPSRPIHTCDLFDHYALADVPRKFLQVFDTKTGQAISEPLGKDFQPEAAKFTPDGRAILTANWDHTARLMDWKTGKTLLKLDHPLPVFFASVSDDGQTIITACQDGKAYLWETITGKLLFSLEGHSAGLLCAKLSRTGRLAVTASEDHTARIWDVRTGQKIGNPLKHKSWVYSVDFSPDERLVATASFDRSVRFWDTQTGQPVGPPFRHNDGIRSVQFNQDGRRLLTASLDGTAKLWDTETHQLIPMNHTLKHNTRLIDSCFGANGEQVLTAGSDGTLTLWDFRETRISPEFRGKTDTKNRMTAAVSPDGRWEAKLRGQRLEIQELQTRSRHTNGFKSDLSQLKFSKDSSKLLVAEANRIHVVQLPGFKVSTFEHTHPITYADFSPDNTKIVGASADSTLEERTARIWSLESAQPIGPPLRHHDGILHAAFSPDSRLLITSGEDFAALIWQASSGRQLPFRLTHQGKIHYASFAEKHPWVVTASDDKTAIIWDTKSGEPLTPPFEHNFSVFMAEFADNDSAIITTDKEGNRWRWPLIFESRSLRDLEKLAARLAGSEDSR